MRLKGTMNADIVSRAASADGEFPWYRLLAMAVIVRAYADLKTLNAANVDEMSMSSANHGTIRRTELLDFFNSAWCDTLLCATPFCGEDIRKLAEREAAKC